MLFQRIYSGIFPIDYSKPSNIKMTSPHTFECLMEPLIQILVHHISFNRNRYLLPGSSGLHPKINMIC